MVRRYGTAKYAEKLPVELFFGPAKRIRRWSDVELHGFCWPENLICISSDFVVVIALSGWKFGSSGLVLKSEVDVDLKAGSRKSEDSKSRSKLSFQSNFSPLHRALSSAHL